MRKLSEVQKCQSTACNFLPPAPHLMQSCLSTEITHDFKRSAQSLKHATKKSRRGKKKKQTKPTGVQGGSWDALPALPPERPLQGGRSPAQGMQAQRKHLKLSSFLSTLALPSALPSISRSQCSVPRSWGSSSKTPNGKWPQDQGNNTTTPKKY